MIASNPSRLGVKRHTPRSVWLGAALAFLVAASYLLIEAGLLGVGDLQPEEGASVIVFVAAACYALGGLLILLRRRWLWLVGAIVNILVIAFFFSLYSERPAVLLSSGSLVSKGAQLALQGVLVYLIVTDWIGKRARRLRRAAPST